MACEKYVEAMHLYSSGNNGLFVNMMSIGTTTTVDILQSFTNEDYVNAFKSLLEQEGIVRGCFGRSILLNF